MAMDFTPEQLSAINTRHKSLLVSAAAGSGKTATLTERIIRSLTDGEAPDDISRMLIVTFTNAAVAELRERITAALKKKLAEDPKNKRLEHQLYMLPSARISTIDSFCNEILKNNTDRFGISPRYRIADPIEAQILESSIWTALINAAYDGEIAETVTPEEFEELATCLTGVKTDSKLEEILRLLYEKSKSHEAGVEIFEKFKRQLEESADAPTEDIVYVKYAMERAREAAGHFAEILRSLISDCGFGDDFCDRAEYARAVCDEAARIKSEYKGKTKTEMLAALPTLSDEEKYLITMASDLAVLEAALEAESYDDMRSALSYQFERLNSVKQKSEAMISYQAVREDIKETVAKLYTRYFALEEEALHGHLSELSSLVGSLSKFIKKFDTVYFNEKKKRAMLEYSDIERLTYLALYDDNGEPSELALSLRDRFSSVYIDEYQDVNALQNKIFLAVSKSNNRFTVGDIKQSIYGFRSARPDIFAKMKGDYPPLEASGAADTASIFMSKNFRCDRGIINFVNDIFDEMFDLTREAIGYTDADRLEFAKRYDGDEPPIKNPEVMLFAKSDAEYDETEDTDRGSLSPRWVAEKISRLIKNEHLNSGEPIRAKDIAIILRGDHGRADVYKTALAEAGISAKAPENKNFFLNSEIQLALCLLNTINNPKRDIYLAGLMMSPLYSFTPTDILSIRRKSEGALWDSVKLYSSENPSDDRVKALVEDLKKYRHISEGVKVDALLMRLYNETGLLALAKSKGCKENLMLLHNYARQFEASSFEGLYSFINYVNTVIETGAKFTSGKECDAEDSVTIMTVHKSKGLEFPIVFLADAAASLVSQSEKNVRVSYSEELGVAMKTRTKDKLALLTSPVHNVIIDKNIERSIEEELRVYYVALTRARERLFVVGAPICKTKEDYVNRANFRKKFKSSYLLREMKTFIDIIYATNTSAGITWGEDEAELFDTDAAVLPASSQERMLRDTTDEKIKSTDKLYKALMRRFAFKYSHPLMCELPEKMSISNLYPGVLDGNDDPERLTIDSVPESTVKRGVLPEFITGSSEHESARRGIATHNFMQFFDVCRFGEVGVDAELDSLVRGGFISEENASRVRKNEIELFLHSELYRNMKEAKKLYREFRFSVMLPAALFTNEQDKKSAYTEHKILLQGVIDCIYEDKNGGLHLIDYKTDRLSSDELKNKSLAAAKLSEKHSLQLSYYALAIREIFGVYPDTARIYSLPLGDTVDIEASARI